MNEISRGVYVGVANKARKVKKMYVGVDGKARKVKKGYIGVNGKARLFYQPFSTFSVKKSLSDGGMGADVAGVSFQNKAIFAGGFTSFKTEMNASSTVISIDKNLTKTDLTSLSSALGACGGASIGNYCIFAGGVNFVSSTDGVPQSQVTVYDQNLTKTVLSNGLTEGRFLVAAASNPSYAVFAGGVTSNIRTSGYWKIHSYSNTGSNTVDAYSANLTKTTVSKGLENSAHSMGAVSHLGNYAVFAGGVSSKTARNGIRFISSDLTATIKNYYLASFGKAGLRIGNTAFFTGGYFLEYSELQLLNVGTTVTDQMTCSTLSTSMGGRAAATDIDGMIGIIKGGSLDADKQEYAAYSYLAEVIDSNLTATNLTDSNAGACDSAAASVGDFALIVGGVNGNGEDMPTSTSAICVYKAE